MTHCCRPKVKNDGIEADVTCRIRVPYCRPTHVESNGIVLNEYVRSGVRSGHFSWPSPTRVVDRRHDVPAARPWGYHPQRTRYWLDL